MDKNLLNKNVETNAVQESDEGARAAWGFVLFAIWVILKLLIRMGMN